MPPKCSSRSVPSASAFFLQKTMNYTVQASGHPGNNLVLKEDFFPHEIMCQTKPPHTLKQEFLSHYSMPLRTFQLLPYRQLSCPNQTFAGAIVQSGMPSPTPANTDPILPRLSCCGASTNLLLTWPAFTSTTHPSARRTILPKRKNVT